MYEEYWSVAFIFVSSQFWYQRNIILINKLGTVLSSSFSGRDYYLGVNSWNVSYNSPVKLPSSEDFFFEIFKNYKLDRIYRLINFSTSYWWDVTFCVFQKLVTFFKFSNLCELIYNVVNSIHLLSICYLECLLLL